MAISYKDLGLVNTNEMFKRAVSGGYAVFQHSISTTLSSFRQLSALLQS